MAKYTSRKNSPFEETPIKLDCGQCGAKADVHVEGRGYCCEHYSRLASNMRRSADRMVYEAGVYRRPTETEHAMQSHVIATYMKIRNEPYRRGAERARRLGDTLRGVRSYLPEDA